ncbi:hypothetical protein [Paracidobacterium acidisoli]|uniref:hypothetical protein n=1 Tax=Paracidobacterium acidisoli TaxID=2303751 RepID=UPI0011C10817|nr:hypothetical protein [Paracidobacterium acidisoli]MBT9333391.1 hypothetical protein [Paracidobacterium acidisoli]
MANIKPVYRISAIVVLIALADLLLLLIGGRANAIRVAPKNPALVLITDSTLIGIGITAQIWLRNKSKYKVLRLLAYALTLAICLAVGLIVVNLILVAIYRS